MGDQIDRLRAALLHDLEQELLEVWRAPGDVIFVRCQYVKMKSWSWAGQLKKIQRRRI